MDIMRGEGGCDGVRRCEVKGDVMSREEIGEEGWGVEERWRG